MPLIPMLLKIAFKNAISAIITKAALVAWEKLKSARKGKNE